MLRVFRQIVHLVPQHEVEIFQQLDLLEVKFALIFDQLLESDLHFRLVGSARRLYFVHIFDHACISLSQARVLIP